MLVAHTSKKAQDDKAASVEAASFKHSFQGNLVKGRVGLYLGEEAQPWGSKGVACSTFPLGSCAQKRT